MTVDEVIRHYQQLGREVFCKDWLRQGILRARYDEAALVTNLQRVFGAEAPWAMTRCKPGCW
jgi:hypothetical protein